MSKLPFTSSVRATGSAMLLAWCALFGSPASASQARPVVPPPSASAPEADNMALPLEEYERRLFPIPPCQADQSCAQTQRASLGVKSGQIILSLEIHALAAASMELPSLGGAQWSSFGSEARYARSAAGSVLVALEPGINKIELGFAPQGAEVVLSFQHPPKALTVDLPGWTSDAPSQGAIGSVRLRRGNAKASEDPRKSNIPTAAAAQFEAPLFLDARRVARFDSNGADIVTTFRRLSPSDRPATATMELMEGEKLITEGVASSDGKSATVDFPAGVGEASLSTRWDYKSSMGWVASKSPDRRETWIIEPWGKIPLKFEGLSPVNGASNSSSLVFFPKPGERLSMTPQAIVPASGAQIAIDCSDLTQNTGDDKVEHVWSISARSTIAAPLTLSVPPDWKVDASAINGRPAALSRKGDKYEMDLLPGSNAIELRFRQDRTETSWAGSPKVAISAPVANLKWTLGVPKNQWVVWTSGPLMGPAILIWGVFAAMGALAYGLARWVKAPFAPSFLGWLGILVPLSALSPWSALVLVAFIGALDVKASHAGRIRAKNWNLAQFSLMALGCLSALILLAGVYQGLIGEPDMMVRGNGSAAGRLIWYQDQAAASEGFARGMSAGALLAPMWIWRALMLGWALWIASSVAKRLPAMWAVVCLGGFWRRAEPKTPPSAPTQSTLPDNEEPEGAVSAQASPRPSDIGHGEGQLAPPTDANEPKKK